MKLSRIICATTFAVLVSSLAAVADPEIPKPEIVKPESVNEQAWTLRWADEFNGPAGSPPDSRSWNIETGGHGFGAHELQTYQDRPENLALDGQGNLVITVRLEDYGGFTSARIHTREKIEFTYGAMEIRAKLPSGAGLGAAIWTGGFGNETPWPLCGERDIVEVFGADASRAVSSLVGASKENEDVMVGQSESYVFPQGQDVTGWHVYRYEYAFSLDDRPEEMRFYVDGQLYRRARADWFPGQWVFGKYKHFLLLNVAVGGDRPWGSPTGETQLPQQMVVDYVRLYDVAR